MLADLHVHSKYSSHALYFNNKKVINKLKDKYPESEIVQEPPTWLAKLIIDGTSHIETILSLAKLRGLGAVAITDHNTTIGNLEAQKLADQYQIIVVPGMELSTKQGEILAYGITSKIKKGLEAKEAIRQIHDQGGVAIAAHPYNPKHPAKDYCRMDEEDIKNLDLDGMEVFDVIRGRVDPYFLNLASQLDYAVIGGSDAHVNYQIGKGLTVLPDSCKNYKDVVQAIKDKNTYATGLRLNKLRIASDMLWCQTFGRFFINRRWVR